MSANNGDMPASPLPSADLGLGGDDIGLTKREHFSGLAPEAPEWFSIDRPDFISPLTDVEEEDRKEYSNENYGYSRFEEGSEASRKYGAAIFKAELEFKSERFFAWRVYYADQLLKALNESKNV